MVYRCEYCTHKRSLKEFCKEFNEFAASLKRLEDECAEEARKRADLRTELTAARTAYFRSVDDYRRTSITDDWNRDIRSLETRLARNKKVISEAEKLATLKEKEAQRALNQITAVRERLEEAKGCTCHVQKILKGMDEPRRRPQVGRRPN
jgi:predicted  nucleic acid-binding Zn-ribbon protein